jgi:lipopolysaccharide transport system ATP-binding protein
MPPAIQVENLSKRYHIGSSEQHDTLRDAIAHWAGYPLRRLRSFGRSSHREEDTIWALKDVSFEVDQGEVLGIIGANGAGKSTLLKILSRITEPSRGHAEIHGRVSSLLEVGTGFHQELTGQENIYLSGAVLGMSKEEIDTKFDQIVDFSGVEKFIDTPVKRYSSGMTVRLGFAIAAHLDPEVMLIDEVLAVGDAEFQQKCVGKLNERAKKGRTVLFVSHNMGAVESLCDRAVLLCHGEVATISDDVTSVIHQYLDSVHPSEESDSGPGMLSTEHFELHAFELLEGKDGNATDHFTKSEDIWIHMEVDVHPVGSRPVPVFGYVLYENSTNQCLWMSFNWDAEQKSVRRGENSLYTRIPGGLLNDGDYRLEFVASFSDGWIVGPTDHVRARTFSVKGGRVGSASLSSSSRQGLLHPILPWEID